ncbi:hypothetical protein EV202_13030 [Bacteroides heparinolyticus]|uniref:Uncharacterized protein n=2 Tax=Prevotella heparinolytica TaxID=28113 RepID=A0A4V2SE78_9BACE|nr:hypothetical protein [Bacteroides heparinolyticus]TCO87679.1 hypothetical protein EV202_13030 [Bacteroides heparinolyticus]
MKNIYAERNYVKMADSDINNYISKRYARWLDYAEFHCAHAGIWGEASDVLDEVLCSLLDKDPCFLSRLLNAKKNGYTELDFFVLRMIKLNVTSPTSPYRSKYKPIPTDENADYSRLDIEDMEDDSEDVAGETLRRMRLVREIFEELDLSPFARSVFQYRFFDGGVFSEWPGDESSKDLYDTYNGVQELIARKISGDILF